MNFIEMPSEHGPILLNLEHVTSVQAQAGQENGPALVLGVRGTPELQTIPCAEAAAVYTFLREQLRPTSFVVKKPETVGFAAH